MPRAGANKSEKLEAVHIRQAHVHENNARRFTLEFGQRFSSAFSKNGLPSERLETAAKQLEQIKGIFDNQYFL